MNIIFATTDRREAERRMCEANRNLSADTITRIGALVEAGAVRVGDNAYHPAGSIFPNRELTDAERAELQAISEQATAETRAPVEDGTQ